MTRTPPRFDEPTFTVPAATLFGPELPGLDPAPRLPELIEPDDHLVIDPSDEPMVRVEHPRIRVLSNYWHAGWTSAIPSTWLRRTVFERLCGAVDTLPEPWGLAVFDAWRPLKLQRELFDAAYAEPGLEEGFMAPPHTDPAVPPPHLTGGAVDVALTYRCMPIGPGSVFDDMTDRSHVAHLESEPGPDREVRRVLLHTMRSQGFIVYVGEWWHFEYGTRRWSAITGGTAIYGPAQPPT